MTESPRRVTADDPMAPYDAVLIGSFGGPRGPEEVTPFLRRVSGGRIPESRLADVAEHYHHFGGVSPINETTDELVDALKEGLARVGSRVPVVLGNRNGTPFMADALRQLHDHGARRVLMLATSAFASYSGCRQYREDAAAALAEAGITDMEIDKLPPFHEAPGFAIANAEALMRAFEEIPPTPLERTRVLFVTHSIPQGMQDASGPGRAGTDYVSQHMSVCSHIADLVRRQYGNMPQWDLVYCSRSGRPTDPWLEPDVNDHLRTLPDQGVESVVLAPVGFVVDHMEVVNDLDREASQTAREIGLSVARAGTAGAHPALVAHLVRYLTARAAQLREGSGLPGEWTVPCAAGCCLRGDGSPCRPAVSGEGDSPLPDTSDGTEPGAEHHPGGHGPGPDGAAEGGPGQTGPADGRPGHGEHEGGHPGHDAPVAPVAPPAPAAPHAHLHEDRHQAGHPEEESMDHRTHHDEDVPAGSYTAPTDPRDHAVTPDEVNAASLWAMYSVFRLSDPLPADAGERGELLAEACQWIAGAGADTRGWYDLSGLRADADLLVWWTSDDPAVLQETYHRMRASWLGRHLEPVWSNLAVHRPAEFNKSHLPSCFAGVAPRRWAAFYPFVRTKDWYLLPAEDRSRMLREHGVTGAASPDVKASTLAAFALGDYEWILTLEGDDLARVVDVMKDLRYVEARRHVEVDIPFFTGERVEPQVWADRQVHR